MSSRGMIHCVQVYEHWEGSDGVSLLDIVLLVIALAVAALTFTQSPFVTTAEIVACYVAATLAGLFYRSLAAVVPASLLPATARATLELGVFAALLLAGGLLLRRVGGRVGGLIPSPGWLTGPIFPALSALCAAVFALVIVVVAVLFVAAVAQMPSDAGLPSLARAQLAQSAFLPRLAVPLAVFLAFVGVWSGGVLPPVYADLIYVFSPS